MNMNIANLESIVSFRKGANAQGVRIDLESDQVPSEIQAILNSKKTKKTK